jgi:hypothetical protein
MPLAVESGDGELPVAENDAGQNRERKRAGYRSGQSRALPTGLSLILNEPGVRSLNAAAKLVVQVRNADDAGGEVEKSENGDRDAVTKDKSNKPAAKWCALIVHCRVREHTPNENKISDRRSTARQVPAGEGGLSTCRDVRSGFAASHG